MESFNTCETNDQNVSAKNDQNVSEKNSHVHIIFGGCFDLVFMLSAAFCTCFGIDVIFTDKSWMYYISFVVFINFTLQKELTNTLTDDEGQRPENEGDPNLHFDPSKELDAEAEVFMSSQYMLCCGHCLI